MWSVTSWDPTGAGISANQGWYAFWTSQPLNVEWYKSSKIGTLWGDASCPFHSANGTMLLWAFQHCSELYQYCRYPEKKNLVNMLWPYEHYQGWKYVFAKKSESVSSVSREQARRATPNILLVHEHSIEKTGTLNGLPGASSFPRRNGSFENLGPQT